MNNNTFSFSRFGRFFLFDLKRWASSYGPAFLTTCLMPVILYFIVGAFSLVFDAHWAAPEIISRAIVLGFTAAILFITYPASVYGFITDKQAGSDYLMIPASTLEKFLSMMLNVLVVVPVVFFLVYAGADALLCAIDGRCGLSLIASSREAIDFLVDFGDTFDDEMSPASISLFWIYLNFGISILYFLLCAICFKKHKIFYPILILIGLNMAFSLLAGVVFRSLFIDERLIVEFIEKVMAGDNLGSLITWFNALSATVNIIVILLFAGAAYYRLKTIKH